MKVLLEISLRWPSVNIDTSNAIVDFLEKRYGKEAINHVSMKTTTDFVHAIYLGSLGTDSTRWYCFCGDAFPNCQLALEHVARKKEEG